MTALGKTMVIFVFLMSLVWAGLVVNTWATRTNWKAEAEKQNKLAKENYDAAKSVLEQAKADRSAADARNAASQASVDRLQQQLLESREQYNKLYGAYEVKLRNDRDSERKVGDLTTEIKKLTDETEAKSVNLKAMEADLNAQLRLTELNKNLKDEAVRNANSEKQRAELLVAQLQKKDEELAAAKQGGRGNARPLAPEDFRGTVQARSGNFVEFTPGLNSGLKPGTLLTVRRNGGTKNYIGTIIVGDQVDPDRAVGTWTAPSYVKKPTGDDFPKPGDEVIPAK